MASYKVEQLRLMYKAEADPDKGGFGAHLTHWSGNAKPVNLDAKAIAALIKHYERRIKNGEEIL